MMYLSNIKLWNFRQFGNSDEALNLDEPSLDLSFKEGMNVLVGENDSGKTAIIDAIRIVLKTQDYEWYRIKNEDFYNDSKRFRIELKFDNLSDNEAKNFIEWLSVNNSGDTEKNNFYLRVIYDVRRDEKRIFLSDVCAGADENGSPLPSEAREYLKVTYLKPLRDAENELTPGRYSRLSSILFSSDVFNGDTQTSLEQNLNKFNEFVEHFFSDNNEEGYKIKTIIDEYLVKFLDKDNCSEFNFSNKDIKTILSKLELRIKSITNPGLGSLNRLYMAAELLNIKRGGWDGVRLCLIEELEAHLHPQAQMKVIECLCETCNDNKIQFILTTHSPNLASKINLENLIMCSNSKCYSFDKKYTRLNEEDYVFLQKFLDTTKANLFFAKGIIFVEGWSEQIFLPTFADFLKRKGIINKTLTEAGVSIINVAGVAFLRYVKIFHRKDNLEIGIPISIVTDSDVAPYDYDKDSKSVENRSQNEIEKKLNEVSNRKQKEYNYKGTIKTFITDYWTFEYALYKSEIFSERFKEIVLNIHKDILFSDFEKKFVEKLFNHSLDKTRIAYDFALELGSFEEKINKEKIENDKAISYLVEAIKFVCK